MHILIVGGTGFIGYHAVMEFLQRHHQVTILALPPLPISGLLPDEVDTTLEDLNQLSDDDVRRLLEGKDAVVYAAGADDRVLPRAPAYQFFYEANVKPSVRLVELACEMGVRRGVLLSSYYAHFDRRWPEARLSVHHPYIKCRREQAAQAFASARAGFDLMVLELPFIFGSMPGRIPLWAPLIDYIRSPFPLVCIRGGTNAIGVKHVGEAVVGAVERGEGGERYLVGDENVTWADLFTRLSEMVGRRKKLRFVSSSVVRGMMRGVDLYHKLRGKEGGLNPVRLVDLLTKETFFDPAPSREALAYGGGGLDEALQETIQAYISRHSSKGVLRSD
jgi:nucleoside-diphosphate-sugar epimerase